MTLLLFHLIPQKLNQLQLNADFFAGSDIDVPLLKPLGGEYNNIWRVIARLTALKSLTIENLNSVNWIRRLNSHFSLHAIKLTQLHVSWTGQQAVAFDLTMLLYRMRDTLTVLELSGPGASKLFHVLGTRISDFKRQQQLLVLDPLYTAADSSPAFIAGLFKLNELKYLALPALQSNDVLPWQEQLLQVGTPKFDIGFAQDPLNCASVRIVGFPRVLCAQMARHLAWYEDPNFEGRATVLFEGFQSIQVHGHRIVDSGILPSTRSDGEESFGRLARLHVSGVNLQQSFAISQNLHFLPSLTSVQLNIDASYKLLTTEEAFRQQKVRHLFIIYALLSMKQLKQIKLTGVEIGLDDIIWIIKGDSLMLNQVTDLAIELSGASWISWPGNSEEMIRTQILPRLPQTGLDSLIITRGPSGEMILNWNRSN
jgi:hypothetical protein